MAHPKAKTKVRMLTVKVTDEQFKLIEQRAEKCKLKRGPWMRSVLIQVAKSTAMQGYIRIREPDGVIT